MTNHDPPGPVPMLPGRVDEMMKSRTMTVSINCSPQRVYEYASQPTNFPEWLTFITGVRKTGDDWIVDTPDGPMGIRFVPTNQLGVLDHYAILPDGQQVLNPMRVVANCDGTEVIFTLFQLSGMTDDQFSIDAETVERDLNQLKSVLEAKA